MDAAEQIAEAYLRSKGFVDIKHEPDGKVPPDFLVDGRIAIEVRRLNENVPGASEPIGLTEAEVPFLKGFHELAQSYGSPVRGAWWLVLRYKRPFPKWGKLKRHAKKALDGVADGSKSGAAPFALDQNVTMQLLRRTSKAPTMFTIGLTGDYDSGGMISDLLRRNFDLCVAEKVKKVRLNKKKTYPSWWLLFVDQIAYLLAEDELAEVKSTLVRPADFDKIILVHPTDGTCLLDL